MLRRRFLGVMTMIGAGSAVAIPLVAANERNEHTHAGEARTIRYKVVGFTCVTCALGLEVLLRQHEGVLSANADYGAATATVRFDPSRVSEASLEAVIQDAGFAARPAN